MLHILGNLVECIGFILLSFLILGIIFEAVMWVVERIFGDE